MSTFQNGTPCALKLDPLKRVNYTFGLVLGVDEFQQEQTYFLAKDRSHYRLAHGYGTIRGLQVQVVTTPDLEVQVSPGVAISPAGQEIHVPQLMCAKLNEWLSNNQAELTGLVDPSQPLSLCVVLGYRECATDTVPVPGEPCRTQQDAMAPSHLADSFQLKLCLNADCLTSPPMSSPPWNGSQTSGLCYRPHQREENATRRFGELLHRIRVTDNALVFTQQADLENLVRAIETLEGPCGPPSSPPSSPPGSPPSSPPGSPPWDAGPIYLVTNTAPELLRDAFRVWVTEVLPAIAAKNAQSGCTCDPSLLLAELEFSINNWQVTGAVAIDESCRPILVETRLLQECVINEITESDSAGAAQTSIVVAAGTFNIKVSGITVTATASGPTYNNLSATGQSTGTVITVLLNWSGNPGYVNPLSSPPSGHSYVVKGSPIAGATAGAYGFQVMGFQNNGILIGLTGVDAPRGFCVEISEVTG